LLAVGNATARRARARGFMTVHSADGDARALAHLAEQLCAPSGLPLFLASGEGQGHALSAMLENAGFTVLHHAVYAAVPVASLPEPARQALCNGSLRSALFFSAETARVFVRLTNENSLGDQTVSIEAVAIGSETAVALQDLPWRQIRVAPKPNQDEMLALLR
jgi:uroporphyrinogen-III synthase